MMKLQLSNLSLLVFILILSACGGGSAGGGSASTPSAADTKAPVITITGSNPIAIGYGKNYSDQGATATDNIDSSVTVQSQSNVNTAIISSYNVTYTATDKAGNTATADRIVNVIDDVAPELSIVSTLIFEMQIGDVYIEYGATAVDEIDGELSVSITGEVNSSIVGDYTISYSATDSMGNVGTVQRTVKVTPTQRRVDISFFGEGTINAANNVDITCDTARSCYVIVNDGTNLTFSATATNGWNFDSWSGCTSVSAQSCTVTANSDFLIDATFLSSMPLEIDPNVIVLTDDQIKSIVDFSYGSGALTLEAGSDITGFEPSKIIISKGIFITPDNLNNVEIYFARRIKQITALSGSAIIIDTNEVALDDIIDSGTLNITEPLAVQKLIPSSLSKGISINKVRLQAINKAKADSANKNATNSVEVIPLALDIHVGNSVNVIGTLDISVDPDINLDFSTLDGLKEFKSSVRINNSASLTIKLGKEIEITGLERKIGAPLIFVPIFAGPAIFIPQVQLYLVGKVDVDLAYEPTFTIEARVVGGAHYLKTAGWKAIKSINLNASANLGLESITAKIKAEAGPKVGFGLLLYGVVGPEVSASAVGGFEAFPVLPATQTCAWDFNTYISAVGKFSGRFSLFSKSLKYEAKLFETKRIFDNASRDCPTDEAPLTPLELTIVDISSDGLVLSWTYPEDKSNGVSFVVYRDFKQVSKELFSTSFLTSSLLPETEYCYYVVAINKENDLSEQTNAVCVTTLAKDQEAPDQPTDLVASSLNSKTILLNWQATNEVAAYVVYDASDASKDAYAIQQVENNETEILGLSADSEFCFRVSAIDDAGNESALSNISCVTTPAVCLPDSEIEVAGTLWVTSCYEGGGIRSEYPYVNGVLNGTLRNYYDNGVLWSSTSYVDGLQHGTFASYRVDGTLQSFYHTADGMLHGEQISYCFESQIICSIVNWAYNERHGSWKLFRGYTGMIERDSVYDNGVLVYDVWYNEDGSVLYDRQF
ncbi:immunoglobulin-like domain-containing protein [Paraglaciecola sp. 25GB23A]|uniref:immunoglobulin-like domain-containing protein n=1 Tax=Paraglaciecola sp. 25GB23A TaxID=3156068 RepID=UPI0032AF64CB